MHGYNYREENATNQLNCDVTRIQIEKIMKTSWPLPPCRDVYPSNSSSPSWKRTINCRCTIDSQRMLACMHQCDLVHSSTTEAVISFTSVVYTFSILKTSQQQSVKKIQLLRTIQGIISHHSVVIDNKDATKL